MFYSKIRICTPIISATSLSEAIHFEVTCHFLTHYILESLKIKYLLDASQVYFLFRGSPMDYWAKQLLGTQIGLGVQQEFNLPS